MGEVYRARDTRLGREVALKILPPDVANDPARRIRFEQEARAVAALNHPNIVGLYDIGSAEGVSFIVTELVPGETLTAILAKGTLALKRLLDIAMQTADGMASAHGAAITHRDLKPANVMVTGDGRVKILDFGLAKQAKVETDKEGTVTLHKSEPGMIVGTVNYMSPEQAAGNAVDYRSDQFSFGLILYEMVTGKRAFERPSSVQTMSAILEDDPPKIEREIPLPLRWVIDRCLAKEPRDRYESSRDLYRDLKSLKEHLAQASNTTSQFAAVAPPAKRRKYLPPLAWLAAGALLAAPLTFWLTRQKPGAGSSEFRFTPFSFAPGGQTNPVWSPDGKAVVYAAKATPTAKNDLYIRYLDAPAPRQLTKDLGATPLAWIEPGRILFGSNRKPAGVWSISTVGGEPEPVTEIKNARSFAMARDGKALALIQTAGDGTTGVWTASPVGSPLKPYAPAPFSAKLVYNNPNLQFSPDGKNILMMINRSGIDEAWLLPFPADNGKPPHQIWKGMKSFGGTPTVEWMPDNRRAILSMSTEMGEPRELIMADVQSEKLVPLLSGTSSFIGPVVSPDGKRMLVSEAQSDYDIVQVNLEDAKVTPLIATKRYEAMPSWALKAPVLVYVTDRNGPQEIWMRKDGEDRPVVTERDFPPESTQWFMAPSVSPDGTRVIYTRVERNGLARLWISSLSGGAPLRVTDSPDASETTGAWSPDGNWFTYHAGSSDGKISLLKVKTSGHATPMVVKDMKNRLGALPDWSPGGDWIAINDGTASVLVALDGAKEKVLGMGAVYSLAFSADGKSLYVIRQDGDHTILSSIDIATAKSRDVGEIPHEFRPNSNLSPSLRLSLAPGGKSLVYSVGSATSNMWLVSGLPAPPKFLGLF
jgi:serine/threonine protein kinase/Tol biopolymer transport system component